MARILIIDDEDGLRRSAAQALRVNGYSVAEASNKREALALASLEVPDLIISDLCMEDGDGVSLLKDIRSRPATASVPFIFMTGHADFDTMLIGAEQAADGILPKPFPLKTLISTVERRLKREQSLRRGAEEIKWQLQRILEASPDLIGTVDPQSGNFLFLNSAGRKLLGIADSADITTIRVHSVHAPEVLPVLEAHMIPGALREDLWAGDSTLLHSSGTKIPVKEFLQAHREHEGQLAYLSLIAHNLSESKRLETERKMMEIQLQHAHKLECIGQLAAGIAHEINTPTQYIGDNARFLEDAFASLLKLLPRYEELCQAARKNSVTPELLSRIESATAEADLAYLLAEIPQAIQQSIEGLERVTKIVHAMKDFSHPGVTEKTMIDINHAIASTITVARNEWKYVASVDTILDRTLPLVPCLPGEFNQVILNLVVNAAHAIADLVAKTGDKGTITVSTQLVSGAVEIRVNDTGGGIPEPIREKIFEPFFTTKEVGKGTGQGLAIARSVVAKHGGTIHFESVMGQGTTFFVRLPLGKNPSENT